MRAGSTEPRTAIWALAEITWEDQGGTPYVAPATIEDTSPSGACLRVKEPISVGSKLIVKWHKEEFSAVARNCRSDGPEFLLGVLRDAHGKRAKASASGTGKALRPAQMSAPDAAKQRAENQTTGISDLNMIRPKPAEVAMAPSASVPAPHLPTLAPPSQPDDPAKSDIVRSPIVPRLGPARHSPTPTQAGPADRERKLMQTKKLFPKFWRREHDSSHAPDNATATETAMTKSSTRPSEIPTGPNGDLLSYEDIYRAAGILRPRSGYDVNKVVEMLHSERMRGLSDEIKRTSVLMAIETAGSSADDLLRDANERQQALDAYEAGQKRQLEEYEARKTQQNAEIEAEITRVTAHYTDRIKANQNQVAEEKEALRNWQMAKQHESQRIAEIVDVCKKPDAEPQAASLPAAASPHASGGAGRPGSASSLLSGAGTGRPN